jgi:hypothetical protein
MSDNQAIRRDPKNGEISLYDLVKPVVKHKKVVAGVALAGIVAAAALYLLSPRVYTYQIDFSTVPIDYASYSKALGLMDSRDITDSFFTKERLGIEPASYFVPIAQKNQATGSALKYFELSYPAPYLKKDGGVDLFRGYLDDKHKLVRQNQGEFTLVFSTRNPNRSKAEAIASLLETDFIPVCFGKAQLDNIIVSKQAENSDTEADFLGLQVEKAQLRSTISLLEQFLRDYPSLIRSNLTLNEKMIPVEVQLMTARSRIKEIDDTVDKYYISQARFGAWKKMGDSYRKFTLESIDPQAFSIFSEKVASASDVAFKADPQLQKSVTSGINLQSILELDKGALLDDLRRISLSTVQGLQVQHFEVKAASKNTKLSLLVLVAGLFVALLSAYICQAYSTISARMREEDRAAGKS